MSIAPVRGWKMKRASPYLEWNKEEEEKVVEKKRL